MLDRETFFTLLVVLFYFCISFIIIIISICYYGLIVFSGIVIIAFVLGLLANRCEKWLRTNKFK